MDTVTAFCASDEGGRLKVDKFIVAGASKRGWTTWTTAAVDDRVVGIIPIVIDTLNVPQTSAHHLAAYGSFSHALKDYEDMKLDRWAGTPQNAALMRIEDPYSYRSRFTMPKLLLNATGDQYFLPDNSQFYFDDLPDPKYLRYVPNTDHSLRNSDAQETILAFCQRLLTGQPLPRLSWTLATDGSIRARATDAPRQVLLWQATNPAGRDFRLESIGPKWTNAPLERAADGTCVAKVPAPENGWTAFFVEFTYARPGEPTLKLTTQVRIVPDTLPFKDKMRR
jgi:PhoPQ-activated pathogenicity-related protein